MTALTGPLLKDAAHRRSSGPSLTGGYAARPAQSSTTAASDAHPASHPLPGVTGYRTPRSGSTIRRLPGRGGTSTVSPVTSARSAPHTPGSPSRLRLQASSPLPRPSPWIRGPGSPCFPPEGETSNDAAGLRLMLRTAPLLPLLQGLDAGLRPARSRRSRQPATGPPGSYPDRTHTGRQRRAYEHEDPPWLTSRSHLHSAGRHERSEASTAERSQCRRIDACTASRLMQL